MKSCIFEGRVSHARMYPVRHRFSYRVFMMYLDLAELDKVFAGRWFWSASRAAPARFRREQHVGGAWHPLDETIRELVLARTGQRPDGAIHLLTNLAYFGYCFNPVSFFYCFDGEERLRWVVAEVTNTPWGERRCYVVPVAATEQQALFDHTAAKTMHVSPFMPMDVDYRWRLSSPGERLSVFMTSSQHGRRIFDAAMQLRRTEISGVSLARMLAGYPFMTLRVIFAIHWQALKLWIKGCPVYPHPEKEPQTRSQPS